MFLLPCFTRRLLAALLLVTSAAAAAEELRISVPLPMGADPHSVWYKLARAIAREWPEGEATVLPPESFEKSIDAVVKGRADVHFPLMQSPARSDDELPYRYSSFTLSETPFALYVRKGERRIDPAHLTIAALAQFRIETDRAHAGLFYGKFREADSIESGLRRVDAGQIDGFLFSTYSTDPIVARLKLAKLVRIPYRRVQDKMVLPRGADGAELDEKLGLIIDRLRDSGEYRRIMAR